LGWRNLPERSSFVEVVGVLALKALTSRRLFDKASGRSLGVKELASDMEKYCDVTKGINKIHEAFISNLILFSYVLI